MRRALIPGLIVVAAISVWLVARRTQPREAPFTRAVRGELVSTLTTNGKAEPERWQSVRATAGGLIESVAVQLGQQVQSGAVLARLDARTLASALAEAEARVAGAEAELRLLRQGGRSAELAEIDSALTTARTQLAAAEREAAALTRLAARQAATPAEVEKANDAVRNWREAIAASERKRAALVSGPDVEAAEARLREVEAVRTRAQAALRNAVISAPLAGTVFELPVRPGSYVQPGDEIARIGNLTRLRVTVYVDEPELGKLAPNLPVTFTWDARPGVEWTGSILTVPTQVAPLGSRQVGEAICLIENPRQDLIPGVNLNVFIRTARAENALIIPRPALVTQGNQTGVWLLDKDRVRWRPVEPGISNVTQAQVVSGLQEGDAIALPTDPPLTENLPVRPQFP